MRGLQRERERRAVRHGEIMLVRYGKCYVSEPIETKYSNFDR